MTVNTIAGKISYLADGSTTLWTFNFSVQDPSTVFVIITDSQGNETQLGPGQYTVTINPPIDPNPTSVGGTVLIAGGPIAVGNTITIFRVLPAVQPVSLANQSILYPTVIEKELDYLTMLDQLGTELSSRAFQVGAADPIPALVPPVAQRANQWAFFDSHGNLVPGQAPAGNAFISAAMQPVVAAATLELARQLMGIAVPTLVITAPYLITQSNNRQVIDAQGAAYYTITIGTAASYTTSFWTIIFNNDTRGKLISIPNISNFILWPGQWVWLFQDGTGNGWMVTNPGRYHSDTPVNFYVHPTQGSDSNDGLAQGTGAFQTIQHAVDTVQLHADGNFTINLADGTYNVGSGVMCKIAVSGADGYQIVGNIPNPGNVIISIANFGFGFSATDAAVVTVKGVAVLLGSGSQCTGFFAAYGGNLQISNFLCRFMGANGGHMGAYSNGFIYVFGPYSVGAGAQAYYHVQTFNGRIYYGAGTVTFLGSVTLSIFFTAGFLGSIHTFGAPTYVNAGFVTGSQYDVEGNSVVSMAGGGAPGSGGSTGTGGVWFG